VTFSIENVGDLVTLNLAETTGQAEAYITNAEIALRPMAMSQEELSALGEKASANAQSLLMNAMQKLPSSVLQLLNMGK